MVNKKQNAPEERKIFEIISKERALLNRSRFPTITLVDVIIIVMILAMVCGLSGIISWNAGYQEGKLAGEDNCPKIYSPEAGWRNATWVSYPQQATPKAVTLAGFGDMIMTAQLPPVLWGVILIGILLILR